MSSVTAHNSPDTDTSAASLPAGPPGGKPSIFDRIPGFARPTDRFVTGWAIALLVSNIGIVATGGAVRLTKSGLGCPTWPRCTAESVVPHAELGIHGVIEFGNRMLTWVLTVIAIATVVAVWRHRPVVGFDRRLSVLLALGIPFQGVIGGITVLTDLNPWIVALHFLLSIALVSGATWLVYRLRHPHPSGEATGPDTSGSPALIARLGRDLSWLVYVVTWAATYLGTVVTGSGPHAGDEDAPRNGLDPANATQLHADAVFILLGVALALVIGARAARLEQFRVTAVFFGLLLLQGLIGVIQYVTDLPIALVIAHMTGSALLIVGATWLVISFTRAAREPAH
ncbi:heme A synthase [Gordonia pseudamarae]|uniref:COX15/CtaA family protein n=1 Tax=Gordonia pseudamarae TaxID=2831662 RepID=UPI001AFBDE94|nr:COX15/CtaA family protein [Gordonia pseudamarae]QHN26521.1 heme A synthase [Gordonia pseudamarae]